MPVDPNALKAELGRLIQEGKTFEALRLAESAVREAPHDAVALYHHAHVQSTVGRYEEALTTFRQCVRLGGHLDAADRAEKLSAALERKPQPTPAGTRRSWKSGLPFEVLQQIQNAVHNFTYKDTRIQKNPFDYALYPMILWQLKPRTILEIGSKEGGSALWMADLCDTFGLDCRIHSVDVVRVTSVGHPRVTFHEGDGRNLGATFTPALLESLPKPWLVIEDADHAYPTSLATLRFFHGQLSREDLLVVEDGIISDLSKLAEAGSGPHRAIKEFLEEHPVEWELATEWCDFFGPNFTWNTNGFLRKTGLEPLGPDAAPGQEDLVRLASAGEHDAALAAASARKSGANPPRGTDYLRAYCFGKLGRQHDALEAAKEELRWHPDHGQAKRLADHLLAALFPPPTLGNAEFKELYGVIRPYTMLSEARLHSLYDLARKTCLADVPGDFAECGVAGGGSTALLAAVIARHSRRPRRVFACDTFTGMPAPTDKDVHADLPAERSGWGSGTCSAPTASLEEVSRKLGVFEHVVPVPGLFADTLPGLRSQTDSIAFLHMDGDWYESTRDILVNLYDRVAPGALIQVDDYGYWQGCRDAVHQFEKERSLSFSLTKIDSTGVWFRKPGAARPQRLLNVGCGKRFHPDWLNLDLVPADPSVIRHDLAEPLPLDDGTCSAVYHSHVLEHLPRATARMFLQECFRVLAPGGILRIAVPDLETIARLYLDNLAAAAKGNTGAKQRLEWMTVELVDQLARHRPGGEMLAYWQRNPMPAEDFVISRMGDEVKRFLQHHRAQPAKAAATQAPPPADPDAVGKFRLGGEIHQWMYDRVSLSELLLACGFTDPKVRSAADSAISGFAAYRLDTDDAGKPRKPDSLYLEARKPASA
jgi:cephalosporin hydroxylase/SAM-dependent methyltransferase